MLDKDRNKSYNVLNKQTGGDNLTKKEKEIFSKLRDTLPQLDKENQKYVLGIVEGMAMVTKPKERKEDETILISQT